MKTWGRTRRFALVIIAALITAACTGSPPPAESPPTTAVPAPATSEPPVAQFTITGEVLDKARDLSDDEDGTKCSSGRVEAGATVVIDAPTIDPIKTVLDPSEVYDGYCAAAFHVQVPDSDEVYSIQIDTAVPVEFGRVELVSTVEIASRAYYGDAGNSYLEAIGKDSDPDANDDTLSDGYQVCANLKTYKGDALVRFILEGLGDDATPAISYLCPQYKSALKAAKNGFTDGDYTVGEDIKPGTYKTAKKVRDCYWARLTGSGKIIDNDLIDYSPQGITVTIRKSDGGFTSERCGSWVRQ